MHSFDNSELEKYKSEAKERWGETQAYKEHAKKQKVIQKKNGIISAGNEWDFLRVFPLYEKWWKA